MAVRSGARVGWPLLPVPDAAGRLHFPEPAESVRQTIRAVLLTRRGERLMRPRFGAGLQEFLHEPNTLTTRRRVRDRITEALSRWERRIVVDRVEVWEVPDEPSHLRVEIQYRLLRTGVAEQMGIVLELEG